MLKKALLLFVFAALAGTAYYFLTANDSSDLSREGNLYPSPADNFEEAGNIVINNPGMQENVWYLVYDSPGAPGSSVKLSFGEESLCGGMPCSEVLEEYLAGARAEVKGYKEGEAVKVSDLEFTDYETKAILLAKSWVETKSPTFLYDGMDLKFVESRGLDLVGCENCYEVDFTFDSRHAGYGDREGEMLAQVITPHEITLVVNGDSVESAVTDQVFDEMEGEFIE